MAARRVFRRFASVAIHALLVLALCGRPSAAAAFFAISCALVLAKQYVPPRVRRAYTAIAVALLIAMTLRFRSDPIVPSAWIKSLPLVFLGVSYFFLRVVRALLDSRPWTLLEVARYLLFFPTFLSGPIIEPRDFLAPSDPPPDRARSLARILGGVIRVGASAAAGTLVPLASRPQLEYFAGSPIAWLWLGAFFSGVWLYLNFSGYSEIYIGLAGLAGTRAPENFDHPFGATDLTSFWQRWHMSLGAWLRSTIYAPLTRRAIAHSPAAATVAGVAIPIFTMVACGAWHMIAPAFLLWGLLHGIGLAVHWSWGRVAVPRIPNAVRASSAYRAASWTVTHAFVSMGWLLFLPAEPQVALMTRLRLLAAMFGAELS